MRSKVKKKKKNGRDATPSIIVACHAAVFNADTLVANGARSLGYPGREVAFAMMFTPLLWFSKRSYDGVQRWSWKSGTAKPPPSPKVERDVLVLFNCTVCVCVAS